jgi:hypothetical protein
MEKARSVWVMVFRRERDVRGRREGVTEMEQPSGLGGKWMWREVEEKEALGELGQELVGVTDW